MKVFNNGHITYGRFSLPLGPLALLAIALGVLLWAGSAPASTTLAASTGANLDQCANGPLSVPVGCSASGEWVNGNLGATKAHYLEGESVPYRLRFSNLAATESHSVTIEWDTTQGGKHALDYITSFDQTVRNADPCAGVISGCSGSPNLFAISADPNVTANILPGKKQVAGNFALFGGTITGVSSYTLSGLYAGNSSARTTITFTTSGPNPVLAWGGHISTRIDWGQGYSAVAISGSPFHTRLIDLDGSGGSQDRSLSSDAVIFPGSITIVKHAIPEYP